jgi:hypothetical protein
MKTIISTIIFILNLNVFAEINSKHLLEKMNPEEMTKAQVELLTKALKQKEVSVIQIEGPEENLKTNNLNNKTCIDDYKQLGKIYLAAPIMFLIDTGLGVVLTIISGGWVPTLTLSYAVTRYYLAEVITKRIMILKYPTNALGDWPAAEFDFLARSISALILVPYYMKTVFSFFRFVQVKNVRKVILHAKGISWHPKAFQRFKRKYFKKFPQDQSLISDLQFYKIIEKADVEEKLCDGSIVNKYSPNRYGKGNKLKQRLARKNEIFHFIHSQIDEIYSLK